MCYKLRSLHKFFCIHRLDLKNVYCYLFDFFICCSSPFCNFFRPLPPLMLIINLPHPSMIFVLCLWHITKALNTPLLLKFLSSLRCARTGRLVWSKEPKERERKRRWAKRRLCPFCVQLLRANELLLFAHFFFFFSLLCFLWITVRADRLIKCFTLNNECSVSCNVYVYALLRATCLFLC